MDLFDAQIPAQQISSAERTAFSLMAIPFFILAGEHGNSRLIQTDYRFTDEKTGRSQTRRAGLCRHSCRDDYGELFRSAAADTGSGGGDVIADALKPPLSAITRRLIGTAGLLRRLFRRPFRLLSSVWQRYPSPLLLSGIFRHSDGGMFGDVLVVVQAKRLDLMTFSKATREEPTSFKNSIWAR